jgi:hypothetical protein
VPLDTDSRSDVPLPLRSGLSQATAASPSGSAAGGAHAQRPQRVEWCGVVIVAAVAFFMARGVRGAPEPSDNPVCAHPTRRLHHQRSNPKCAHPTQRLHHQRRATALAQTANAPEPNTPLGRAPNPTCPFRCAHVHRPRTCAHPLNHACASGSVNQWACSTNPHEPTTRCPFPHRLGAPAPSRDAPR